MTTRRLGLMFSVAALTLVCLTPVPADAVDREHQQIMADIRMLEEQTQQLQQMLSTLGDALKQLNSRLDDQTAIERKAFADGKVQMDNLSGDVRIVREKVDETNVRLSSLSQEMEALRTSLPAPGTTPAPPTTSDATQPTAGASPTPAATPAAAPVAGQTPQRLYDQAFADYSMSQFPLAVQGFEAFIKYFPKSDMNLITARSRPVFDRSRFTKCGFGRNLTSNTRSASIGIPCLKPKLTRLTANLALSSRATPENAPNDCRS